MRERASREHGEEYHPCTPRKGRIIGSAESPKSSPRHFRQQQAQHAEIPHTHRWDRMGAGRRGSTLRGSNRPTEVQADRVANVLAAIVEVEV